MVFALAVPTKNLSSQSSGWSSGGGAVWIEAAFLLTPLT